MTPEQLREAAAVILAAAGGKKIEQRWRQGTEPWAENPSFTHWNFDIIEYRVKPEPRKVKVRFFVDRYGYLHALSEVDIPAGDWKAFGAPVEIEVRDE